MTSKEQQRKQDLEWSYTATGYRSTTGWTIEEQQTITGPQWRITDGEGFGAGSGHSLAAAMRNAALRGVYDGPAAD